MLQQQITFTNFDGDEVTKTYYFHFTKTEIIDLFMTGELEEVLDTLKEAAENLDRPAMIDVTRRLILMAYGERDGDSFLKSDEIRTRFESSLPFEQFYFDMLTHPDTFMTFMEKILPADMIAAAQAQGKLPESYEEALEAYNKTKEELNATRLQPQDHKKKAVRLVAAKAAPEETVKLPEEDVTPAEVQSAEDDLAAFEEWKRQRNQGAL
jgi:hypothetical protein